jgi:hypothetical protein
MTLTLSKVMQRAWREMGFSVDITATGGSATTIVDANTQYTSDDSLVGGTALVVRDAGGAGASPEGRFARITDFVASTKTFTVDTITDGVASGDSVLLATPRIKLPQMIQAVNDGLSNLGTISLVDTSLSLSGGTYSYDLPVALKITDLKDLLVFDGVMYQSVMGLAQYFPAAPGTAGTLQFSQIPFTNTLKIVYEGVHPTLSAYSDKISETIQEELAVAAAIDKALTWYISKRGDSALGTFAIQRWNDAKQTLQMQNADKPVYRAKKATKWFVAGDRGLNRYPGDRNPR